MTSRKYIFGKADRSPLHGNLSAFGIMTFSVGLACVMQAQVLYDPSLGTLPTAQGWGFVSLPAGAPLTFSNGLTLLETASRRETLAGISRLAPVTLDRSAGFRLAFSLQVNFEDHGSRVDRAGISVTVIGDDRKGIELGFWDFRIWAQSDSPLFVHAEEAVWETTRNLANYALTIQGNTYSLTADGRALLTGPVRDYTSFVGLIDPYETPNFLFVGDNTTSARGAFALGRMEILPIADKPPELSGVLDREAIRIWWPISAEPWNLESSSELGVAADWRAIDPTIIPENGQNEVRMVFDGNRRFFRLRQ